MERSHKEFCLQLRYKKEYNGYKSFVTHIKALNKPDAIKKAKEKFGEDIIVTTIK
jgi:hypothetical protein